MKLRPFYIYIYFYSRINMKNFKLMIKTFLLFIMLTVIGIRSNAQDYAKPSDLIANIRSRHIMTLDGKWRMIIDPYETGYLNYRLKPFDDPSESFAGNRKARKPSDLVEYNFDKSPEINVPGDWNTQSPELLYYEGSLWYKKSFSIKKEPGHRYFIYFGAINYEANIYLNAKHIGDHRGGFTSFDFEITSQLNEGDNFIVVHVNNTRRRDGVPTVNTDWWNYGGITRSVYIVDVPEDFIQDYLIQLAKGKSGQVDGWVKINGTDPDKKVTVRIPELKFSKDFDVDNQGMAKISFDIKPQLWTPDNPKLYDVTLVTAHDTTTDQIGFRTIETRGTDILLNGKPIFLRGVCIHEEAPFRSGRAYSEEDAWTLLTWAKELGCNFVRLAHYPHNENMIRMADKMGIMVWSEIPVYWTILWENEDTYKNAENQLEENITRDKNRACIIIWSMGNETPRVDARLKFMSSLAKKAGELDSTRLISAALEIHRDPKDQNTILIDDPLGQYLDVYGCNEYLGWYEGTAEQADNTQWKSDFQKPLVLTEFGAGALQGMHGDKDQRWTEEFQANVYEHNIKMFGHMDFLRGTCPWILMDFRSPKRVLPDIQDGWNRKGLISDKGIKKEAFFIMQKWYNTLKEKNKN